MPTLKTAGYFLDRSQMHFSTWFSTALAVAFGDLQSANVIRWLALLVSSSWGRTSSVSRTHVATSTPTEASHFCFGHREMSSAHWRVKGARGALGTGFGTLNISLSFFNLFTSSLSFSISLSSCMHFCWSACAVPKKIRVNFLNIGIPKDRSHWTQSLCHWWQYGYLDFIAYICIATLLDWT